MRAVVLVIKLMEKRLKTLGEFSIRRNVENTTEIETGGWSETAGGQECSVGRRERQ